MENVDLGTVILVILVLVGGWVLGNVFRTAADNRGYAVAAAATTKTHTARKTAPKKKGQPGKARRH